MKHPRRWLAGVGAAVVIAGGAGATVACTCDTPVFGGGGGPVDSPGYFECRGPDDEGGCWEYTSECTTTISSGVNAAIIAAAGGAVICVTDNGNPYPEIELTNVDKTSEVIVRGAPGDLPIFRGIDMRNGSNLTFEGVEFSPPVAQYQLFHGNVNLLLSHVRFTNGPVQFCTGITDCGTGNGVATSNNVVTHAEFLHITNTFSDGGLVFQGDPLVDAPSGFKVIHSLFTLRNPDPDGQDGCSDGMQLFANVYNVEVGWNEFTGLNQVRVSDGVNCSDATPNQVHVDPIQPFGGWHTYIHHNWFHNQGNAGDYGCHDECHFDIIENNVFVSETNGRSISAGGNLDSTDIAEGLVVNHNMIVSTIGMGNTGDGSHDNTVTNNVVGSGFVTAEKWGVVEEDYNMCLAATQCDGPNDIDSDSPVFVGGAAPTTYCGWQLAPTSPGYHAGSDGESIGITGDICE